MHGIYIRVSTFGQNTAGQKREIQNWLNGNGGSDVKVRWYVDKATGNDLNRPEFERLQKDIFDGKVNTVVVWKLDRLSRNLRDGINTLSDWCERGLRVVSVTQQIDFSRAVVALPHPLLIHNFITVTLGALETSWQTRPHFLSIFSTSTERTRSCFRMTGRIFPIRNSGRISLHPSLRGSSGFQLPNFATSHTVSAEPESLSRATLPLHITANNNRPSFCGNSPSRPDYRN